MGSVSLYCVGSCCQGSHYSHRMGCGSSKDPVVGMGDGEGVPNVDMKESVNEETKSKVTVNENTETDLPGTVTDIETNDTVEETESADDESKDSSVISSDAGSRVASAKPVAF